MDVAYSRVIFACIYFVLNFNYMGFVIVKYLLGFTRM